jgi:hypothetical protein
VPDGAQIIVWPPQKSALWRGCDVVVGTPGRVLDHIDHGNLQLSSVKYLVRACGCGRVVVFGFSSYVVSFTMSGAG